MSIDNLRYEIDGDSLRVSATTDFSKRIDKQMKEYVLKKYKIAEIDAELNGGQLVEVCRVLGKPLYIRVNHHDPEMAHRELVHIREIVKEVVLPNDQPF